ncbi:GTP-binding protein [Nonomuraea sp. SBT364]|uniref:GTP-binding protein n=1 Tax=Nonomuraea sp. SBT364 TaxID=1580530 RepID=UPI00066B9102|nr:GTP-binding protein [Nonomuraea sp. SBT364]
MEPAHRQTAVRHDASTGGADGPRHLNLGVLAHVDAGKTSLTEALLHAGGAIGRLGRVDAGTTQTDSLALERQRGITIRAAVAAFSAGDVTVNLVDTPGHPDFIAEVDRSLAVLDGAVLVLSAVEGVQAQTVVLYRALRRLGVPVVLFVNKIDRRGAAPGTVLDGIRRRLSTEAVPLGAVRDAGTASALVTPLAWDAPEVTEDLTARLAAHDDDLLEEWLAAGRPLGRARLYTALARLTRAGTVHPLVFGSARTGAGVGQLIGTISGLLTPPAGDGAAPVAAQVFKVERAPAGGRLCTVRMRAGALRVRDRVPLGGGRWATVTGLEVFEPGGPVRRDQAGPGQIARVRGLEGARIGDWIGDRIGTGPAAAASSALPAPGFESRVTARDPARHGDLHRALSELADIDPLIAVRPDRDAVRISIYGEVQQQVLAATLAAEFGIAADFGPTTVRCVERPSGVGAAVLRMGEPGHPHDFTLGVRVEPAAPGSGVELVVAAERSGIPLHVYTTFGDFRTAVLGYLAQPLACGPHGWPVTDLRVTVTEAAYPPAGPRAAEVRYTTEAVVHQAITRAGTTVCEPVDRFAVETPPGTLSAVLGLLARNGVAPQVLHTGDPVAVVTGTARTTVIPAVRAGLHGSTHGQGVLESRLDHYTPIPRATARRPS